MGHAHDSHRPFKFPPTCGGADGRRSAGRWTITPQLSRALGTACMGDARAHGGVPTPRAPVAAFSAGKRLGAQIFHGSGSSHLQTGRRAGSHPRRNTSPPPPPGSDPVRAGGGGPLPRGGGGGGGALGTSRTKTPRVYPGARRGHAQRWAAITYWERTIWGTATGRGRTITPRVNL